jgi:hypothetical protein
MTLTVEASSSRFTILKNRRSSKTILQELQIVTSSATVPQILQRPFIMPPLNQIFGSLIERRVAAPSHNHRKTTGLTYLQTIIHITRLSSLWGQPPAGQSRSYDCDLSEIEIGIVIEIEKVWDLDFDPNLDFDNAI